MTGSTAFWDRIAARYARKPVADEAAYQRKLAISRKYFTRDTELLEIGCGTGSTALAHAPYVKHIRAIDFSPNMIAIAEKKRIEQGIDNITFECRGFGELADGGQRYDGILALSVLHLLDDWQDVIGRVHDLLVPGGVFISSTACIRDMLPGFRFVAPLGRALRLLPELSCFTAASLRRALEDAGFAIACEWQPGKRQAVFLVARKPAREKAG